MVILDIYTYDIYMATLTHVASYNSMYDSEKSTNYNCKKYLPVLWQCQYY